MGPELQIVVLDMSLEEQIERVRKRHGGDERIVEFAKVKCEICEDLKVKFEICLDVKESVLAGDICCI